MLVFALTLVGVATASSALLLRAALTLRGLDAPHSERQIEEAIRQVSHYWISSATFWVVALAGSILTFFAAGAGVLFLAP